MFGVVLWSDIEANKAVIWCEDQGDLAYYHQADETDEVVLDAGDLVRFEMTMDRHLRFAHNPQLISEGYHPDLSTALTDSVSQIAPKAATQSERLSAEIIPFRTKQPSVMATTDGVAAACPR